MDDSEKPTIETEGLAKRDAAEAEWKLPEPVFRTTKGVTPGKADPASDPEKEIPTEAANKAEQSVRVKTTPSQRHKKKKGSCAKFFTLLAVLVGLLIGSVIVAAVYFLFYYRGASTTF